MSAFSHDKISAYTLDFNVVICYYVYKRKDEKDGDQNDQSGDMR